MHEQHPDLPVIVMTAHSDLGSAVSAYESGAFEYLPKPFDIDQAVDLVRRAAQAAEKSGELAAPPVQMSELLGRAPAMQQVFRAIGRLSRSSVNVLVTGESRHRQGTRRARAARAQPACEQGVHRAEHVGDSRTSCSNRSCSATRRASFTGADSLRRGRFEQADGGTLFLDEIGDMNLPLQTRLLRVLAEGEFYRVGGQTPIRVDVRVIAATHQNLEERVAKGLFREDLFHRLNVIRIELPPLRARREDIPDLLGALHEPRGAGARRRRQDAHEGRAASALTQYNWPGNVRELVNLCRRLTVLAPGSEVHVEDLPAEVTATGVGGTGGRGLGRAPRGLGRAIRAAGGQPLLDVALPQFERTLISVALKQTQGHRQAAAKLLGWGRNTLTRKLKELGMDDFPE